MGRKFSLAVAGGSVVLLLGYGITAQSYLRLSALAPREKVLSGVFSRTYGFAVRDLEIASSAEMKAAVGELLNFDEAIYKEFSLGGKSFSLYAAYWRPGKMHPRLVAVHVPDVCWVAGGWRMRLEDRILGYRIRSVDYWPAQSRYFEKDGIGLNVLYWHVVGGSPSSHSAGDVNERLCFLKNFWENFGSSPAEQFFVRISSRDTWETWENVPNFMDLIKEFAPILQRSGTGNR